MLKSNQSSAQKGFRSLNEFYGIFSSFTGLIIMISGILVILGWQNNIFSLQTFGLGNVPLKPNLAAGFILIGLTLVLLQFEQTGAKWVSRVLTVIILLLGLVTIKELIFNSSSGFDEFLLQKSIKTYNLDGPFRMALNAAISLSLSGILLFYLTLKSQNRLTFMEFVYVMLFSINLLGLISNIFGLNEFSQYSGFPRMSILAMLLFILVCFGLFMSFYRKKIMKLTIDQIFLSGFVFLGSTILYFTLLAFSGFNAIRVITDKVEQTQKIMNYLSEVKSNILDIESGVRGYLISNDEVYLEQMKAASIELPDNMNELRRLIPDNKTQHELLDTLQQKISERVEHAEIIRSLIQNEGSASALILFESGKGKILSDRIRVIITSLENEENQLLITGNSNSVTNARKARTFIIINFILQIGLLIAIFIIVRGNIIQRRRALNQVRLINNDLDRRVKERTELLARSEERFRSTLETMIEGAQIIGFDWTYLYLNSAAVMHSRLSKNEMLGNRFMDVWPGVEETKLFQAINKCMEDRIVIQIENEFMYPDESQGWFDLRIQPVPEGVFILSIDITERKKAEKSISFLVSVLRNINEFVSITDTENNISYVNQSWITAFGYSEEEVLGKNIELIVAPSNPSDILNEILTSTMNGGWQGELINRKKDGTEFPVMLLTTIIYDKDQKPIALVGISRDITEGKKAEESIRVNEKRLKKAQEIGHLGYWQQEIGGNSVWASSEGMKIYGFPPKAGEISSEDLLPCIPDIGILQKAANDLIIHNKKYDIEFLIKPADGSPEKIIAAVAELERDNEGIPVRIVGVLQDITTRRNTENELNKHRLHLEELVEDRTDKLRVSMNEIEDLYENAPCGYHSLDSNGTFIRINNTELTWLGYAKEEVINKVKFADLLTHDSKAIFTYSYPEFLKKGEVQNLEFELIRKDKSTFFVSLNATAIYDSSGKYLMSRSTLFDITGRKLDEEAINQARKAAEDANRAKSEFLANMSHEIRTPMNAVLGYTELLSSMVTEQTQKNYIESIKSSGRSLLTLINDILDLSKIESGKLDLEYDYVESSFFFTEFERIFALKAAEKGIKFIVEIQSGTPSGLYIDEPRLRQIIFNLIGNAIKFTHQGSVKLKVHTDNLQVINYSNDKSEEYLDLWIEVEDTGVGISKEIMEEIFDPFIQARDQKNIGGTGLGLAITRRLTSLMKGTINLKSELGKGSTFTVKIPDIAFKREFINTRITIQVNPSDLIFDPCTILVVDDVEHNRSFIRDTLRNTAITVIEAGEGFKALEIAKKVIPTLIISDIRMPNMDGFELLSRLKANNKLKHIPVLAYSASVLKDQKDRIHKSQFVGLLTKPVNITELYLELMNHLPYKEVIKKKTDQSTVDTSKSEIKDLKSLISSLESEYMEAWRKFEIRQPIAEIKKFGEDLIRLGSDHNSTLIKKYGSDLLTAGESFNIEAILILLKQYSVNLENLKTLL